LAKFYNGYQGLSMASMDSLGEFLQLTIHLGKKPADAGKPVKKGK